MSKLIHDIATYTAFFRDMATYHKKIKHSSERMAFARMNLSAHPMLAREDIREFLRSIRNKLHFPALLINYYAAKFDAQDSHDAKRMTLQGEFFILDRYHKDDFDGQQDVFEESEQIGLDIINFLGEYYEENSEDGIFIWNEGMMEKISNLEVDNLAGTKFYFTLDIPSQVKFNLNTDAFDPELFE